MTVKEMFNKDRLEAERLVRLNKLDTVIHMSGSKIKKSKYENFLNEYIENSKIDYELGVIEKGIHEYEMNAAEILKKSLNLFIVYGGYEGRKEKKMKLELHTMEKNNVKKAKEYCKKHKMKFKFIKTEDEIYYYDIFGTSVQIEQFVHDNDVIWFR